MCARLAVSLRKEPVWDLSCCLLEGMPPSRDDKSSFSSRPVVLTPTVTATRWPFSPQAAAAGVVSTTVFIVNVIGSGYRLANSSSGTRPTTIK